MFTDKNKFIFPELQMIGYSSSIFAEDSVITSTFEGADDVLDSWNDNGAFEGDDDNLGDWS